MVTYWALIKYQALLTTQAKLKLAILDKNTEVKFQQT